MNDTRHPGDDVLVAFALDETPARERAAIETHLDGCETCRGIVLRLHAALEAYRTVKPPEAPAHVLADLLEAQAAARAPRPGWRPRLRLVFVTAGLIALAGIFASGFWIGRSTAPAGTPATAAAEKGGTAPGARPLPERPAIEFRAEPPLMTGFTVVAEAIQSGTVERGNGSRDSL